MWSVNVLLPYGLRVTITSQAVYWTVACVALLLLLWAYVEVLHQGLERGDRLRAEQRRVAAQPPHKGVRTATLLPSADKP